MNPYPGRLHWSLVALLNAVNCANSGLLCALTVCPVRNMIETAAAAMMTIAAISGIIYLVILYTHISYLDIS